MCLAARRTRENLAGSLWFFIAAILLGHAGRQHRSLFLVRLDKLGSAGSPLHASSICCSQCNAHSPPAALCEALRAGVTPPTNVTNAKATASPSGQACFCQIEIALDPS